MGIKWDFDGNDPKAVFRRGMSGNEAGNGNESEKIMHSRKTAICQKKQSQKFLKRRVMRLQESAKSEAKIKGLWT